RPHPTTCGTCRPRPRAWATTCPTCTSTRRADMAGHGAPELTVDGSGARVAVVASSWHTEIMDGLVAGAERALKETGVNDTMLVRAAGSFELPIIAQGCAKAGFDVVVALGVIIRGGTPHFEYVSAAT